MQPARYARVAAAIFAAEAVFAVIHLAVGGTYRGSTRAFSVVTDAWIGVLWGASAIAGFVQRPWQGHFVMFFGMLASIWHGVMISVLLSGRGPYGVGITFLAAGAVQAYCLWHAAPAFYEPRPQAAPPAERHPLLARLRLRHTHS
jgi:hypothetical protein